VPFFYKKNTKLKIMFRSASVLLLLPGLGRAQRGQGQDGNPHGWDRRRRCDQTDYQPACGICEGVGGIAFGDDNEDITLAACAPVTTNVSDPVKPHWGERFTANHYNEILIGPKTDPFCFNSFPSNSSAGKLCYRADSGRQVYDALLPSGPALRYDLNVKTVVGNVSSTVIHSGRNLWIINKLPWYAAGVHQCICTTVHEGGADANHKFLYPIQYNWTDQMFFMGREHIGIEYTNIENYTEELNHWAFGPHHVWSKPDTGEIRRMWQPFNGLQVFHGFNRSADSSLFDDLPPKMCQKKGGASIRIKCDDHGMPVVPNSTTTAASSASSASVAPPSRKDLVRAKTPKPSEKYRGADFSDMSGTLNGWLSNNQKLRSTPCKMWQAADIQKLQAMLYLVRDESLNDIYERASDNRRMRAAANDLSKEWKELNDMITNHPGSEKERAALAEVQRDGHCHEAVMWYVHHLTEDMKIILSQDETVHLPLLSETLHSSECGGSGSSGGESDEYAVAMKRVCDVYKEQVTCASCHSDTRPPPGHDFLSAASWNTVRRG
jgi:hypothetical protein